MTNDFKPFGSAMTKIQKRQANKSYEIYLSLYQAVTGTKKKRTSTSSSAVTSST
jgi:type I restriction enzyme R subunit